MDGPFPSTSDTYYDRPQRMAVIETHDTKPEEQCDSEEFDLSFDTTSSWSTAEQTGEEQVESSSVVYVNVRMSSEGEHKSSSTSSLKKARIANTALSLTPFACNNSVHAGKWDTIRRTGSLFYR